MNFWYCIWLSVGWGEINSCKILPWFWVYKWCILLRKLIHLISCIKLFCPHYVSKNYWSLHDNCFVKGLVLFVTIHIENAQSFSYSVIAVSAFLESWVWFICSVFIFQIFSFVAVWVNMQTIFTVCCRKLESDFDENSIRS